MLQVSMGALVSLVIIMLTCFVLPFLLFYLLYRYADGRLKTLLIGAAAYIACGVVADTSIAYLIERMGSMNTNAGTYLLYAAVLSPLSFIFINYLIMRRFGEDNMKTTGDSAMYSVGYSTAVNMLTTGIIAIMYFLTLLDIRGREGGFYVVSDADYVSASQTVSASNVVNESVYNDMIKLCSEPVSYYVGFILNCLWIIGVMAAILPIIWLAVRKANKPIILAFAFVMRLFIGLPDIIKHFNVIQSVWVTHLISIAAFALIWTAAVFCYRMFIDTEDAVKKEK